MKKFRSFPIYSVGFAALSIVGTAQASKAITLGPFEAPGTYPTVGLENTEINQTFQLPTFDSSLGTLNSVTIEVTGQAEGDITLTLGNAQQAANVRGTTTSELLFSVEGQALNLPNDPFELEFTTGFVTLQPNTSSTVGPLSDVETDMAVLTSGNIFNILDSDGSDFNFSCQSLTGLSIQGGSGFAGGSQTTMAGCGVSVTYDYSTGPQATPEASSLLGLGLIGGLGLLGANKSRKKQA